MNAEDDIRLVRKFLVYLSFPDRVDSSVKPGFLMPADEEVAAMEHHEAQVSLQEFTRDQGTDLQRMLALFSGAAMPYLQKQMTTYKEAMGVDSTAPVLIDGGWMMTTLNNFAVSLVTFLISEGRIVVK